MLRPILALRGVQSPQRQDWLDLNPSVCSDSTGPSGVKSDILSYWVWVILVPTFWRCLGNSRLWPAIWLFIPRVGYQQTRLPYPRGRLIPATLKNLLNLCSITSFCYLFFSQFPFLQGGGLGESKCEAILSVPGFPKFAGFVQNLLLHQLLQSAIALWSGTEIDFHTDPSEGICCLSTADPELHVLAEQCTHCLFLSSPLQKITNHRKCWTNCFNLTRPIRKLPFPIIFSPSQSSLPWTQNVPHLFPCGSKLLNGFWENSYCFPSQRVTHSHLSKC